MFNLIVKYAGWASGRDTISAGRVFEYTDQSLIARFTPNGQLDFTALATLPCIFLQETSGLGNQLARVGTITRARQAGSTITLEYVYDPAIPAIPNVILQEFAVDLEFEDFQFARTHWSVKDVDLYRTLLKIILPRRHHPSVFQISEYENIEPSLVSAMMPFSPSFDAVYSALQSVSITTGLRCRRADDIWENPAVMQDVVSLIDRSKIIIADCTGRNPNVFYEIGIAHTLGREVILITQNEADIPFDLRHLRYVLYLNNREGLEVLVQRLQPRLADLTQ